MAEYNGNESNILHKMIIEKIIKSLSYQTIPGTFWKTLKIASAYNRDFAPTIWIYDLNHYNYIKGK